MIAYLGMYDRPETAAANDAFWQAIRTELGQGPAQLTRDADVWDIWKSPDLLLAQTCGMPYRTRLYNHVQLVGTPDYDLPECPPGHYNSVILAHKNHEGDSLASFDGQRFAYNEALSQSGWAAPVMHMREQRLMPGELLETGSHQNSALAVAEGRADFASLDAVTWTMIQRYDDFASELTEIARTSPTPALPFITSIDKDRQSLFGALTSAVANLTVSDRVTLQLAGMTEIPPADYLAVPTPLGPTLMVRQGRSALS